MEHTPNETCQIEAEMGVLAKRMLLLAERWESLKMEAEDHRPPFSAATETCKESWDTYNNRRKFRKGAT